MSALVSRATTVSYVAGGVALILVVVLVAAPWWTSIATERLIGEFMVYLALATLWNLLAGYAGLVSVGQQAYVGFGAYVLISLASLDGWSPLWAVPVAGLGAAINRRARRAVVVSFARRLFRYRRVGSRRGVSPYLCTDFYARRRLGH